MRILFKWIMRLLLLIALLVALLFFFGPREVVDLDVSFDETRIGPNVNAYLQTVEARFDDIVEGTQKRVIWAGAPETKTPVSVLYVHGYSATSEEIRPVPDRLAAALGANLVFTRLSGHGRTGEAMAEPTAADWMRDTLEALAIARAVGERVIVVSTSTGGTLVAAAALREDAMENVAGAIFVSPNFAINSPAAVILTWPGVRWWGPLVAGAQRSFETLNEGHEKYWTNSYPTVALMPMAALVKAVDGLDLGMAKV
ncbi:MAG: alpha/beta fold hydrolase, partial [Planktotalea sp.]|uniref:alpha/beta hydrolase n=1 Tax=Planktotalea sp. TaxID=2029877 RepID=UPI003C75CFEC